MAKYYVNDHAQEDSGDHEVHKDGCSRLKLVKSSTYLGEFSSAKPAVAAAKKIYPSADGCYYCCPEAHTS